VSPNLVNAYSCACPPGFTGTNCQINIDDCAGQPCQHGGACVDGVNGYTCQCPPGFSGANCEIDVDECVGNQCQNGAVCVDGVNGYTCACAPGFSGPRCATNIDDCAGQPCQNGGACTDGVNGYTCACAPGFSGPELPGRPRRMRGQPVPARAVLRPRQRLLLHLRPGVDGGELRPGGGRILPVLGAAVVAVPSRLLVPFLWRLRRERRERRELQLGRQQFIPTQLGLQ
jgi:hypothetical protein